MFLLVKREILHRHPVAPQLYTNKSRRDRSVDHSLELALSLQLLLTRQALLLVKWPVLALALFGTVPRDAAPAAHHVTILSLRRLFLPMTACSQTLSVGDRRSTLFSVQRTGMDARI